jgi:4-amino-4-deoxy-L-arabinose transferase-like glycosyltransferase
MIQLIALLIFAFCYLAWGIWGFSLITPDEPRYAETAREMIESGDWIVPYCDYNYRFHKPILFYWLEAISFKCFGLNEFAARLPSVLSGLGLTGLAYLIGNLHGFGITAALITLSSLEIFIVSKLSITDMSLCFFTCAALVFFYVGYIKISLQRQRFSFKERVSSYWFILSAVMIALGVLCKGPVAVVLPLSTIGIFLFLKKDLKEFVLNTWLELLIGFVLFLIITLPWYISVHIATNGEFTKEFFLSHNFDRFSSVHSGHDAPIWYYLPVIAIGFLPWTFFLIQSLLGFNYASNFNISSEKAEKAQTNVFCAIWAVLVFVFFTIAQTKLPTYIIFIYLPLSIIVARWWSEKYKTSKGQSIKNLDGMIGLIIYLLATTIALILSLTVIKTTLTEHGFFIPVIIISFILISSILISMTAIFYRARIAFAVVFIGFALSSLLGTNLIFKKYSDLRNEGSKEFMRALPKDANFNVYKTYPTRFSFYGERRVENLGHKKFIEFLQNSPYPAYFITKSINIKNLERFLAKHPELDLKPEDLIEITKQGKVFIYGTNKETQLHRSH